MKKLEVTYLGLKLKNPVIVSSSGLTSTVSKIEELEKAGAGAVVLKSLFEEQINIETASQTYYSDYPEASDYVAEYTRSNSINKHLELISEAKRRCSIPIIASINCVSSGEWIDFAKKIEDAGADALEINIFILPVGKKSSSAEIEKQYLEVVEKVCKSISIPVSVKLGRNLTDIPGMVREIYFRGAKGVVMFNRFYEPDIDIETMSITSSSVYSSATELRNVLRWVALTSSSVKEIDYAASTGIHDGEAAIKALLAGADVVEVCSAIYMKGDVVISEILDYIKSWMERHNYVKVRDFVGKMSYDNIANPLAYERSQFMKYFSKH